MQVRGLLQKAQAQAKALRELEPSSEQDAAFQQILSFSALVRSAAFAALRETQNACMQNKIMCICDGLCFVRGQVLQLRHTVAGLSEATRSMWEQRCAWLHDELIALVAERLQHQVGKQLWQSIVALLFCAAERLEAAEAARLEGASAFSMVKSVVFARHGSTFAPCSPVRLALIRFECAPRSQTELGQGATRCRSRRREASAPAAAAAAAAAAATAPSGRAAARHRSAAVLAICVRAAALRV